ncbi:S-adenosyl-L-methionine-dependent methyltransferase, partial [Colletotrichum godetiae]
VDFQHLIWSLTLEGNLAVCPAHRTAKRVLDMGTGTGVWAIAFGCSGQVIGVDFSPIQPSWAPHNCTFEIDDLEKPWAWHEPFNFIFCRTMEGSFADPQLIIQEIYDNLTPGGWFEAGGFVLPMGCDDGSVPEESALRRWHDLMAQAGEQCGRSIESPSKYTKAIEDAGFVDIVTHKFVWPLNTWPKDKRFKEIGRWMVLNLDMGIEALTLGLLTRVMGWTEEEVLRLCDDVRKDLSKTWYHAYWNVHVVYARKPLQTECDPESQREAGPCPRSEPPGPAKSPEPLKLPQPPKSSGSPTHESPKSSGSSDSPPRKRKRGCEALSDP